MSVSSVSDLFRQKDRKRNNSVRTEADMDFREGVLLLNNEGVFVQRYFTIYDYQIAYAYRGKERKHEFSPVTTIEERPAGLKGQHTFRISTEGQKTLELAANNDEDLNDWIKAIKDEVGKIIVSIMEDFERTGYGPHADITQGSDLEEGNFGSYVLRQQGSKVIPLFMYLKDGRLALKRRPTDEQEIGGWKINPKTSCDTLPQYAGAAIQLDKEILLASNISIRSNWIVALKRSVQKASGIKGAGSQRYVEIDFGTAQKTDAEIKQEAKDAKKEEKEEKEEKERVQKRKPGDPVRKERRVMQSAESDDDDEHANGSSENSHHRSQSLPDSSGDILTPAAGGFDFGGTMMVRTDVEDDENDFYKTFAGSIRISGKVALENFSTFREVAEMDDDQEKFANMKLEFEEVNPEDDSDAAEDVAVLSIEDQEDSPGEDKPGRSPTPSSADASTPTLSTASSVASLPDSLLLPATRTPNRARSSTGAKKPNMMRIRLKSKSPEGPIKIYRGCLESKDEFKCLVITSDTKTEETLRVALEEFQANSLMYLEGKYVLIEEEVGDIPEGQERYRRILDPQESPLIAKLNWDYRNMHFAIATKDDFATDLQEGANFKVRCIDQTTYSMKYHAKLSVSRVCEMLAEKYQLQKVSYSLFSLWMVGDKLELQLEPFKQLGTMADDWPKLEKNFTEVETGGGYQLFYKRWAFLSKSAERRVKDPQAIALLYEQAQRHVMEELYPAPQEPDDLIVLAGCKCQLMFGDYKDDVHTHGYISKQSEGMTLLFPPYYFNMYFKKDDCEKKVIKQWIKLANHPRMIVQMLYLQIVRQWPYYGCTFFPASMTTSVKSNRKINLFEEKTKNTVRVGVNVEGVHIVDAMKNVLLFSDDLQEITLLQDLRMPKSFIFESKKNMLAKNTLDRDRKKDKILIVCLTSPQVPLIHSFVQSSLRQQQEDARALRIMRNLQRKRSATDAQSFHREHQVKFSTQKHLSPAILRQIKEDAES